MRSEVEDIRLIVARAQVWNALAFADIRSKYRFSTFGSLWITLTTGALALSIGLIYGQFFGQDVHTYLPYFTASYITWSLIATVVGEACITLIAASNFIRSSQMPIVFHVQRMIQKNFIIAAHNIAVLILVWLFVGWKVGFDIALVIPGLVLLYLFLSGLSMILAVVCVRFRDIPPLVQVLTQFLFFVTPIIWYPEQLRFGRFLLDFNPMTYMLIVVRDPILGRPTTVDTWLVAVALTALVVGAGAATYVRFRNRIAYWV